MAYSAKMSDLLSETDFISNLYQRELVHVLQIIFMALPMKSLVDCKKVCHGEFWIYLGSKRSNSLIYDLP